MRDKKYITDFIALGWLVLTPDEALKKALEGGLIPDLPSTENPKFVDKRGADVWPERKWRIKEPSKGE